MLRLSKIDLNDDISRDDIFNLVPCAEFGGRTVMELCNEINRLWENDGRYVIRTDPLSFLKSNASEPEFAKADPQKIEKLVDKLRAAGKAERVFVKDSGNIVWARVWPPQAPQPADLPIDKLPTIESRDGQRAVL